MHYIWRHCVSPVKKGNFEVSLSFLAIPYRTPAGISKNLGDIAAVTILRQR